jgi:hypothetical protein
VWRPGDGSEEQWWLELIVRAKEGAKGLKREGKMCGEVRGWCSPLWGPRERRGGVAGGGVTVALNVFNAIEDGEVKGRVKEGVLMMGRVKAGSSLSRRGAGRRGVAERGEIRRRRSRGRPAQGGRWS